MFKRKAIKKTPEGREIRPQFGKCPRCGAGERQWCKSDCTVLDPANMVRE